MEIVVNRSDLSRAMSATADFTSKASTQPKLRNIMIEADATRPFSANFFATDGEKGVRYSIPISGQLLQPLYLPSLSLREFVGLAAADTVTLTLPEGGKMVIVRCGGSRVSIKAQTDVVELRSVFQTGTEFIPVFEATASQIGGAFAKTSFVSHPIEGITAPHMDSGGVRMDCCHGVMLIAHDGSRVARVKLPIEPTCEFGVTIPVEAAKWLGSRKLQDPVKVYRTENKGVVFESGPYSVYFRTADVSIPDMSNVFAPDFDFEVHINTKDFLRAITVAGHFSDAGKGGIKDVVIEFSSATGITVNSVNSLGDIESDEVITYTGTAPVGDSMVFDPRYLTDFLKAGMSEAIAIRFLKGDGKTAGKFRMIHKGDAGFTYIAMAKMKKKL